MDIWAVSTVWLLLIMLLQTLVCVSYLESTKRLLYPRGKYLALQFWNRRVALFLTSFLIFFKCFSFRFEKLFAPYILGKKFVKRICVENYKERFCEKIFISLMNKFH